MTAPQTPDTPPPTPQAPAPDAKPPQPDPPKDAKTDAKTESKWAFPAWLSLGSLTAKMDGLLGIFERLTVLLAMLLIGYIALRFVWQNCDSFGDTEFIGRSVRLTHENWRAFAILLSPLAYRVVRQFLDELEEVLGMKRRRPLTEEGAKRESLKEPPRSRTEDA